MPLPLPLSPTSFLDSQGNTAWYEYLMSLSMSRAWAVPEKYFFDDDTERDDYFTAHPEELVDGVKVSVDSELQQYNDGSWESMATYIQGEPGADGADGAQGPQGPQGDPSNTISVAITPSWSGMVATISDADWSAYDEFTIEYNGAVATFNKNYSSLTQYVYGASGAYKVDLDKTEHTVTFDGTSVESGQGNCYAKKANSGSFVPTTRTVAGYALSANITTAQLSTALGIGSLATSSELATAIAGLASVYQPIGSYLTTTTAASTYQAKALAASIAGALTPTTQYPSVQAVADYALPLSGGTVTGAVANSGGTTLSGKAHRNIQFVEGTSVEALAGLTNVEDGDIVFLYPPLS